MIKKRAIFERMFPIPPPHCPPNNKNNFYHLTTDTKDPLLLRILRTIGYVLLHIITLGLLLLIHYYKHHRVVRKEGLPTPPTLPKGPEPKTIEIAKQPPKDGEDKKPDVPKPGTPPPEDTPPPPPKAPSPASPKVPKQPADKKPTPPPEAPPPPVRVATPMPLRPSSQGYWQCLNRMVSMVLRRAPLPLPAMQVDPILGDFNPHFVASYPNRIDNEPMYFQIKQFKKIAQNPDLPQQHRRLAQLSLEQALYLNDNYYLVNVPGDGNCFYRAYAVGWLSALYEESSRNDIVFEQEATRLLDLPFASSSPANANLCAEMAELLQLCSTYCSFIDLYDGVILSQKHTATLIAFLRKLSAYAIRQQIAASSNEETARALFISDMQDDLLPSVLEFLAANRPYSELFQNLINHSALPYMQSRDKLFLLLEHLPALFLTDAELQKMSPEDQQLRKQYEREIREAFAKLSRRIADSGWDTERFNAIVKDHLPEAIRCQYSRFLATIENRRSGDLPWSPALSFFAFLCTCPSVRFHKLCATFYKSLEDIIIASAPPQRSIQEILQISNASLSYLNEDLDSSWQREVISSNIMTILTTHESLTLESSMPQLETLHKRIANLLKNVISTSFETPPLSNQPDLLSNLVNKLLVAIHSKLELKEHFNTVCSARSLRLTRDEGSGLSQEQDLLYTQAVQLLFFILQHPQVNNRPETKDAVKELKMLLLPFLQYAFKKVENEKKLQKLLRSILGSLVLKPPARYPSTPSNKDKETFCKFWSRHPEVMVLDPILEKNCMQFLRATFPNYQLETEAILLEKEIESTFRNGWNVFLTRLNLFGSKLGSPSSPTALSDQFSKSFLIFCFLNNYPKLLQKKTPLAARLDAFQREASHRFTQVKDKLLLSLKYGFPLATATINQYSRARDQLICNLLKNTVTASDGFCRSGFRQSLIGYLHSLSSNELGDILDDVKEQAEANDVAAMTTVPLQPFAVCLIMSDRDTVSEENIENFVAMHGFLNTISPERDARIFLIRFPNHYGCLLPRNPRTEDQNSKPDSSNP
ncbi:hypothetical protein [Chlamydia pneumoniae]|nr:hypothetical protein [Chlamydia pneumoniae]